jgi:hypothetical protein
MSPQNALRSPAKEGPPSPRDLATILLRCREHGQRRGSDDPQPRKAVYTHLLWGDLPDVDLLEGGNTGATSPAETGRNSDRAERAETRIAPSPGFGSSGDPTRHGGGRTRSQSSGRSERLRTRPLHRERQLRSELWQWRDAADGLPRGSAVRSRSLSRRTARSSPPAPSAPKTSRSPATRAAGDLTAASEGAASS